MKGLVRVLPLACVLACLGASLLLGVHVHRPEGGAGQTRQRGRKHVFFGLGRGRRRQLLLPPEPALPSRSFRNGHLIYPPGVSVARPDRLPGNCPHFCRESRVRAADEIDLTIVALLSVRVFREDKAKLWTGELVQWIHYMRYAGVGRILVCDLIFGTAQWLTTALLTSFCLFFLQMYDSFVEPHECQLKALLPFIDEGFLEYTNWTEFNPYDPERTQMAAYYNGQLRYEDTAKYWVHFDIDEYPFAVHDQEPDWLLRELDRQEKDFMRDSPQLDGLGVILMPNVGLLGFPNAEEEMLLDRFEFVSREPLNDLVKPIERNGGTDISFMHATRARAGWGHIEAQVKDGFIMLHVWGARLTGYKDEPMKPELLKKLRHWSGTNITRNLQQCRNYCRDFYWVSEPYWDSG